MYFGGFQSLQDIVVKFTSLDWSSKGLKSSGSEDGSHMFEVTNSLLGYCDGGCVFYGSGLSFYAPFF